MIKLNNILNESIFTTRRSREDREKNRIIAVQKQIQQYIKDGSRGDLDLSNLPFSNFKLPNNLTKVGGALNLTNTDIYELPPVLDVERLDLEETPIFKLPSKLTVRYELDVSRCINLFEIENIRIIGNSLHLNISFSGVKILGDNITVRKLTGDHSKLTSIGKNFHAYGYVSLTNCYYLKTISSNFKTNHWVDLSYSGIEDVPRDMYVGGVLDIEKTKFQTDYLHKITNIAIEPIPKNDKFKQIDDLYPNIKKIVWNNDKSYRLFSGEEG